MCDCMHCSSPCIEAKKGKSSVIIHGNRVIACAYSASLPEGNLETIMKSLQDKVKSAHDKLGFQFSDANNAFNNIRGAWTRHIFGYIGWNIFCNNTNVGNACLVSLPSISALKFIDLFDPDASEALRSGLLRRLSKQGVELTMSNPDFICVSDVTPDDMAKFQTPIINLSIESQDRLLNAYKTIKNCCSHSSMKFGIAMKTSLRSDRRYQVAYEGSILKALIAHLQVRYWDTDFQTYYYAVVANKVSDDDRSVMSAPATHSIVDVHTPPVKAIDDIFEVKSTDDLKRSIQTMIDRSFSQL